MALSFHEGIGEGELNFLTNPEPWIGSIGWPSTYMEKPAGDAQPTKNYQFDVADRKLEKHWRADPIVEELYELFPEMKQIYSCPGGCVLKVQTLANLIPHLVDVHDWSREQIVEWLDSEPEQAKLPKVKDHGHVTIKSIGPGIWIYSAADDQVGAYADDESSLVEMHNQFMAGIHIMDKCIAAADKIVAPLVVPKVGFDWYCPGEKIEPQPDPTKLDMENVKYSYKIEKTEKWQGPDGAWNYKIHAAVQSLPDMIEITLSAENP